MKGKMIAGLNNIYCCTYWTKKKSHLRTYYDFAHLADLALVVQKMDNPIQSINLYPMDSAIPYLILTYWIVIYLLDSAIQRLYNRRLYFIVYIIWLLDIACLFDRLLQAVIFTVFFFPSNQNFIGRARRVQIKNVVLPLCRFIKEKNISNKHFKLDSNGSPEQVLPSPVNPALHAHA